MAAPAAGGLSMSGSVAPAAPVPGGAMVESLEQQVQLIVERDASAFADTER